MWKRAGMGREAWKSPRMGESRSSVPGRVIRASHAALTTVYADAGDEHSGWATREMGGGPESLEASTVAGERAHRRPSRDLAPVLGRYRLSRRLGAGGFATVWLAWDERLQREVALKLLPRERIASGRFEREARAAARLNHPGIVVLYEAAVDDEGGYLVSELVRGHTLGQLLGEGRLSDRDIIRVAVALCDALQYAHRQGVVHRDVKPSNVLMPVAPSTSAEVAKLTDFGVARLVGADTLTRTGDVLGTSAYMAPEQAAGREAEAAADLYSLALVVYEALTGVNPLRNHVGGRLGVHLPAVRRYRRDLPRELACAVDLALRPRPRERGAVAEFREALMAAEDQVGDEPGVVEPPWGARPTFEQQAGTPLVAQPVRASSATVASALAPMPDGWTPPVVPPSSPPRATVRIVRGVGGLARLLAAIAAAAATAWFASSVLSPSPVVPVLAVLVAGLAVAVLPRAAWLVLGISGALLLVAQGDPGGAVVLLVGILPPAVLLFRHPGGWALPALAAPLAVIGLGGLWPALAGRSSSAWERMVLGASGWLWLLIGGFLDGRGAYVSLPPGTASPRIWMPSLAATVHQVIHPLLYSGILAPALVWAAGALVLPLITVRRPPSGRPGAWVMQGVLLLAWAGALLLLTRGVLGAFAPSVTIRSGPAIFGAFSSALVAALGWPLGHRLIATPGSDRRTGLA
jgi:serine/threonine protein kinase